MKVSANIRFLARQGLVFGRDGSGEVDGNFNRLLHLHNVHDSDTVK